MANDLTGNPWAVDTTGVLTTDPMRIQTVRWVGAGANDTAVIEDAAGRTIWASIANVANYVETHNHQGPPVINGLTISALDGGVLYITY